MLTPDTVADWLSLVVLLLFCIAMLIGTIRDYDLVLMFLHEIISLATRAGFRVRPLRHDALQPHAEGQLRYGRNHLRTA